MNNQNKELIKEKAVFEKRYWLRISNTCNNHCIFCLDANNKYNKNFEDLEIVKNKLINIYDNNYRRIILSGGEASIHPNFNKIVLFAKNIGFEKIQTITNGRMFSYKSFTKKVINAGLNEVTFSIHGHNSQLHDKLTGINGAFEQVVEGVKNVLETNNCIVNIDIVINNLNYIHVKDIIDYFSKFHIYEYDLLYIIPFGRAFKNKDNLFLNYKDIEPFLNDIFSYSKDNKYYIWTNRFPPSFLEGYEDLIQDPHKLYDEINGRESIFNNYEKGKDFHCYHPDRCFLCYINEFCDKYIKTMKLIEDNTKIDKIVSKENNTKILDYIKNKKQKLILEIDERNIGFLESKYEKTIKKVIINYESDINIIENKTISNYNIPYLTKIKYISNIFFKRDLSIKKWIIELNKHNNNIILENITIIDRFNNNIYFVIPSYEKLSEAREEYENIFGALCKIKNNIIYNCAPCINKNGVSYNNKNILNLDVLKNNKLIIEKFLFDYILTDYFVKSERCKNCKFNNKCKGMHINFIRIFGFKVLKEIV